jgi:hypothetical protein
MDSGGKPEASPCQSSRFTGGFLNTPRQGRPACGEKAANWFGHSLELGPERAGLVAIASAPRRVGEGGIRSHGGH